MSPAVQFTGMPQQHKHCPFAWGPDIITNSLGAASHISTGGVWQGTTMESGILRDSIWVGQAGRVGWPLDDLAKLLSICKWFVFTVHVTVAWLYNRPSTPFES